MLYLVLLIIGAILARPIRRALIVLTVGALLYASAQFVWAIAPHLTPAIIVGIVVGLLVTWAGAGWHRHWLIEDDRQRAHAKVDAEQDGRRVWPRWF